MKFNDRLSVACLLVPLILGMAGCGGEPQEETPDETGQQAPDREGQRAQNGAPAQEQAQRTITRLSDNVYRAQDEQHFTVFLVTPEGIILADPINRDFSTWLKSEIATRFQVPVEYVLYSHHHWDHASGGAVFEDTATFIGHENTLEQLRMPPADTPLSADAAEQDANGDGVLAMDEATGNFRQNFSYFEADGDGSLSGAELERGPVADVRRPDITYREKAVVSLGGHTAELSWTGPIMHTDDMSVIRFPGDGVVFVVDFINIETLPYRTLGSAMLDEWLQAIRDVEAMAFEVVAPGHGTVGGRGHVADFRRYLEELREAVATGIEQGKSLDEMQRSIELPQYSDWFMYDAWLQENIAGMHRLLTSGE